MTTGWYNQGRKFEELRESELIPILEDPML